MINTTFSKQVLVIGRSGQVARSLAACAWPGAEIVCIGREAVDLTQLSSLEVALERHKPWVVINAAAYTAVDRAEQEPEVAFAVNRDGPAQLARLCAEADLPLIHFSTDYVFDGAGEQSYRESDPVGPLGVYGASKLAGEEAVRSTCPKHVILRTSWVYSPYGTNFMKTMLRLAKSESSLSVVNDQWGCPTYAPDIAEATVYLVQRFLDGEVASDTYHMAGRDAVSWFSFAEGIFAVAAERGRRVPTVTGISTEDYPTSAMRPKNSRLDCSRLDAVFGLQLPGWRSGVERCLDTLDVLDKEGVDG